MLNFRGIQIYRKEIYTTLSLLLSLALFGMLVNDFIAILSVESPENNSHSITFLVLFVHCVSFILAILGCVYSSLAEQIIGFYMGIISAALNMSVFVIRITLELVFLEFRPEELAHSA